MASFQSFTASPFYPNDPSYKVVITREEFQSFHGIDRDLFSRFVFVLNRDVNQSSQVMAFLLLIEQLGFRRNLTASLLASEDVFIDAVANEVVLCLSILYNQDYSRHVHLNHNNNDDMAIPFLKGITESALTLGYINQNRESIIVGVAKNLSDVCNRAFDDLYERAYNEQMLALERARVIEEMKKVRLGAIQQTSTRSSVQPQIASPSWWNGQQQNPNRSRGTSYRWSVRQGTPVRVSAPQERAPAPAVEEEAEAVVTVTEVTEKEGADNKEDEEEVTEADDRTVFLTFSKGYPISESEVMTYFTRKFGDVIEAIVMKDVKENEQPLFARMVLKMQHASMIEEIVTPMNKNKFTIGGKHVCARKYVRSNLSLSAAPYSSHV